MTVRSLLPQQGLKPLKIFGKGVVVHRGGLQEPKQQRPALLLKRHIGPPEK